MPVLELHVVYARGNYIKSNIYIYIYMPNNSILPATDDVTSDQGQLNLFCKAFCYIFKY